MSLPLDLWGLAWFFGKIWITGHSAGSTSSSMIWSTYLSSFISPPSLQSERHIPCTHPLLLAQVLAFISCPQKVHLLLPAQCAQAWPILKPSLITSTTTCLNSKLEVITELQEETIIVISNSTTCFPWAECQTLYKLSFIYCSHNPIM